MFVDKRSQSVKALDVTVDEFVELELPQTGHGLSQLRLSLSADGRQLLYAQPDHSGADLLLVENFR